MLFNSAVFIFLFLPITLIGYFALNRFSSRRYAIAWLVLASAFFYGWFSVRYLALLAVLILLNYAFGVILSRNFSAGRQRPALLIAGIALNLAVLAYFKYMNFFIDNANALFGTDLVLQKILLPIGISFFTFQKIAYLVDAYRGEAEEYNLLDFSLFVMYFPQLIAGPIVHHKEIIPQFRSASSRSINVEDVAAGLALFSIGLIKKVAIADTLVGWSDPVFAAAQGGHLSSLYTAWTGALAFTLQIYFDFSGYTDMALGLALMIGIRLPLNFDSPYKATNIIDFWRRWHMTLSRFLRDYVYIPLGGNRKGPRRRIINLMLTMLLGGLWHGAAWTFVVWGGLHGLYLVINHGWRRLGSAIDLPWRGTIAARWAGRLLTFLAVVLAWVFFRSESFGAATIMLRSLLGHGGFALPTEMSYVAEQVVAFFNLFGLPSWGQSLARYGLFGQAGMLGVLLAVVFLLPNSQQLLAGLRPALQKVNPPDIGRWLYSTVIARPIFATDGSLRLNAFTGFILAAMLLGAMAWQSLRVTSLIPFIYFQF